MEKVSGFDAFYWIRLNTLSLKWKTLLRLN